VVGEVVGPIVRERFLERFVALRVKVEQVAIAAEDLVVQFAVAGAWTGLAIGLDVGPRPRHDAVAAKLDPHVAQAGLDQQFLDVVVAEAGIEAVGVAEGEHRRPRRGQLVDGVDGLQDVAATPIRLPKS